MEIKFAYKYRDEVKMLFTEYTKMLVENDPKFQEYLDLQNYDDELDHLEAKYGLPDGRLYLLLWTALSMSRKPAVRRIADVLLL